MKNRFPTWYRLHSLYIRSTVIFKGSRAQRLMMSRFNCHWRYFMTWLRALLNGNGYKNVLEVYISNENTFTRMIMKSSDNRQFVSARRLCNCMLKTIVCWSRWSVVLVVSISHWKLLTEIFEILNSFQGEKWQTKITFIFQIFLLTLTCILLF